MYSNKRISCQAGRELCVFMNLPLYKHAIINDPNMLEQTIVLTGLLAPAGLAFYTALMRFMKIVQGTYWS